MRKSDTNTIISALRILAVDIKSDDGVANACIFEAADRLEELQAKLDKAVEAIKLMTECSENLAFSRMQEIARQTLAEIGG